MGASQWELSAGMIESGRTPGLSGMTNRTIVTKVILHMIGISYTIEITYMAGIAIGRCSGITTGMTIDAGQSKMSTGEWEICIGMIESSRTPGLGGVTNRTIVTEVILHMIWIRNTTEIILMAGITIDRCSGITTGVAVDAG